jgi:hypothetical protein
MNLKYPLSSVHYPYFNSLSVSQKECVNLIKQLYVQLELHKISIKKTNFDNFVENVEKNYTNTTYHNFNHAIDVVFSTLYLAKKIKPQYKLDQLELIGTILGALLHDVGHYGKSGKYVSVYDDAKIKKYGKISTLEKFHFSLGMKLVKESQLFDGVNKNCEVKIKKIIKSVILATDPSHKIETFVHTNRSIYNILIRCADISSVLKTFKVHRVWSNALMKEFYQEGKDLQRCHNVLKLDALFDENKKEEIPKQQEWFYVNYAEPHFEALKPFIFSYNEIWNKIQANKLVWFNKQI